MAQVAPSCCTWDSSLTLWTSNTTATPGISSVSSTRVTTSDTPNAYVYVNAARGYTANRAISTASAEHADAASFSC
jgi:hypothetical protein